jgi:hypothetical protein
MCLSFSNQKKVLKYFGWFVGYKEFSISIVEGLVTLKPFIVENFEYKFKVIDNKLVAEPYNQEQKIYYTLNVYNNFKEAYDLEIERTAEIGYHIFQFSKNFNAKACFRIFYIGNTMAVLPVIFGEEHIQMIGYDVVVEQFAIPNRDLYISLCELYYIKPEGEIIEFLEKLFESYS